MTGEELLEEIAKAIANAKPGIGLSDFQNNKAQAALGPVVAWLRTKQDATVRQYQHGESEWRLRGLAMVVKGEAQ